MWIPQKAVLNVRAVRDLYRTENDKTSQIQMKIISHTLCHATNVQEARVSFLTQEVSLFYFQERLLHYSAVLLNKVIEMISYVL